MMVMVAHEPNHPTRLGTRPPGPVPTASDRFIRPAPPFSLVTGATGLLGSHLAERLLMGGGRVRALVRPSSDTSQLSAWGVEIVEGDLTNPHDCRRAVEGVDVVFHAGAKVGDWGPWREFESGVIQATANLAEAAAEARVGRFLHIGTTSAYGHPPAPRDGRPLDERAALYRRVWMLDHYTRAKFQAERIVWTVACDRGLPVTVLRPSWLYGERDRITFPRLIDRVASGRMRLVGRGDNILSAIYAGNVADAAILAATHPAARGEVFNVTDQGLITQAEFFNLMARHLGAPEIRKRHNYHAVFAVAVVLEGSARLLGLRRPPLITRYAAWLLGRRLVYSSEKIKTLLRWNPPYDHETAMRRTIAWFQSHRQVKGGAVAEAVVAASAPVA